MLIVLNVNEVYSGPSIALGTFCHFTPNTSRKKNVISSHFKAKLAY
jgi:hypothetical protein